MPFWSDIFSLSYLFRWKDKKKYRIFIAMCDEELYCSGTYVPFLIFLKFSCVLLCVTSKSFDFKQFGLCYLYSFAYRFFYKNTRGSDLKIYF